MASRIPAPIDSVLAAWDAAPMGEPLPADELERLDERTRDGERLVPSLEVTAAVERMPRER